MVDLVIWASLVIAIAALGGTLYYLRSARQSMLTAQANARRAQASAHLANKYAIEAETTWAQVRAIREARAARTGMSDLYDCCSARPDQPHTQDCQQHG